MTTENTAPMQLTWQPIETAPKGAAEILLYNGSVGAGFYKNETNYHGEEGWHWESDRESVGYIEHPITPTHWMPLPPAPSASA
jgi:Protein of unknown function (DUF551)